MLTADGRAQLFTPEEVARELKLSESCLASWRQKSRQRGVQVGPRWVQVGREVRYLGAEIQRFVGLS